MLSQLLSDICRFVKQRFKLLSILVLATATSMMIALAIGKIYQHWDNDPDRGAIAINNGAFGEDYSTPIYLDQGWDASDSLWFYNTTQGSALLPYDFYIALEQADTEELFRSNANIDKYRYLPQKPTFFNPDGLSVGFVKDTYQGKDYMGYTCAACHTGQVNYQGKAIRIDGGPAMADMVGFLKAMQKAMEATLDDEQKQQRFTTAVLALGNDYRKKETVINDFKKWTKTIALYNTVNHSHIDYGYARLDAFGRIYNRVLEHMINKEQARELLLLTTNQHGERILNVKQVDQVLEGINETIIGNEQFAIVLDRLRSTENGYPGLSLPNLLRVRDRLFNEPNAPVSYPFLWDIAQSTYVQWNGIASNGGVGPLGRNAGEVIGVFGILDWSADEGGFDLAAKITGQESKKKHIDFKSSIDLVNLERLEHGLKSLQSPQWPEDILGKIDRQKVARGQLIYAEYCQSCHEVIDRDNWDRIVVAKMSNIDLIGTDPAMASNSVNYSGKSGNFKHTYQKTEVGTLVVEEDAPVAQILTVATSGVVATPDPDKWVIRRWLDWLYTLAMSFFQNEMKNSVKVGNYIADTTANPYQSLLSYKARSLNGIWATAPYLHNGSVPSLYDLLLPAKREGDPEGREYRPESFVVGSREFDPLRVGFRYDGYEGFKFNTFRTGDLNDGHEYGAGRTPQLNGDILPSLTEAQRWDLVEYMKTL